MNTMNTVELGFIPAFQGVVSTELSAKYGYPIIVVSKSNVDYWTILGNGGAVAAISNKGIDSKHICVCEELLSLWKDELEVVLLHEKGHLVLNHHMEMVNASKQRRTEMEVEADRYAVTTHSKGSVTGAAYLLRVLYSHDNSFFSIATERASQLLTYRYGL